MMTCTGVGSMPFLTSGLSVIDFLIACRRQAVLRDRADDAAGGCATGTR